jgi:polyhydroxybutyrate depolymerase
MNTLIKQFFIILAIIVLAGIVSCVPAAPSPTLTVAPTATVTLTAPPAPTMEPSNVERQVMVNDEERSYLLHIPPGLNSLDPIPVVFAFHGSGQEPATMRLLTGFDEIADKGGFLVVYPEGLGLTWNAGTCCGYASTENVDEPAFILQILSDLGTIISVDNKRVYAAGFSNGGALMYRLACEMSDTFAAVAPVAGAVGWSPCQPQQSVSLIIVHGLADIAVPYIGGGEFEVAPVEEVISTWAQLNGCSGSPQTEKPQNLITHTAYTSCEAGTAVELYAIESGGHAWPSKYVWPGSDVIWDFFAAHPKP